jgi:hypothetical protein
MLNGNCMVQFIDLPTYSMCYLNQPMWNNVRYEGIHTANLLTKLT